MSEEANIALVRSGVALIGRPEELLDRFDELFSEDFTWTTAMVGAFEGGEYRGREGFARYLSDFEASFPGARFDASELRATNEATVLVLGRITVRGRGSGVELEREVGYVFEMRQGRIASGRTYLTQEEAVAAAEARAGTHAA